MEVLSPIDWEYLHQISDHDPDFEQELLEVFIADTQIHLANIQAAASAQDSQGVRQEAHYIKGASANVGATAIHQLAARLEEESKQGDLQNAPELLNQLEIAYAAVESFVRTLDAAQRDSI